MNEDSRISGSNAPRIALALGAGGIKGWAHVGVIRTLRRAGVPIDLIVGASAGALIGPLYAARASISDMERVALAFSTADFARWFIGDLRLTPGAGPAGRTLFEACGNLDFDEMAVPFAAVAHDVASGRRITIREGSVGRAVEASIRPPFWGRPVKHSGMALIDGGLQTAVPVDVARELGASLVIGVNVGRFVRLPARLRPHARRLARRLRDSRRQPAHALSQAALLAALVGRDQGVPPHPDIEIRPDVRGVSAFAPWQIARAVAAGDAAARKALPDIRLLIEGTEAPVATEYVRPPRPTPGRATGTPPAPR